MYWRNLLRLILKLTSLFLFSSGYLQYHIVIEAREAFKRRTQRSGSSLLSSESYDDFSLQQLDKIMQKDQLNRRLNEIRQKLLKTMTVDGAQAHKVVSEDRTIYTLRSLYVNFGKAFQTCCLFLIFFWVRLFWFGSLFAPFILQE